MISHLGAAVARRNLAKYAKVILVKQREELRLQVEARKRHGERTDLHTSNFHPKSDESPMDRQVLGQIAKRADLEARHMGELVPPETAGRKPKEISRVAANFPVEHQRLSEFRKLAAPVTKDQTRGAGMIPAAPARVDG